MPYSPLIPRAYQCRGIALHDGRIAAACGGARQLTLTLDEACEIAAQPSKPDALTMCPYTDANGQRHLFIFMKQGVVKKAGYYAAIWFLVSEQRGMCDDVH